MRPIPGRHGSGQRLEKESRRRSDQRERFQEGPTAVSLPWHRSATGRRRVKGWSISSHCYTADLLSVA
jgi:hypothetical protein